MHSGFRWSLVLSGDSYYFRPSGFPRLCLLESGFYTQTPPVPCEECQRLTNVYLAAVSRNNEAAAVMAALYGDGWQHTWRAEMRELREACEKALAALDQHRREHGC